MATQQTQEPVESSNGLMDILRLIVMVAVSIGIACGVVYGLGALFGS